MLATSDVLSADEATAVPAVVGVGVPDFVLLPHAASVRAAAKMAHVARALMEVATSFRIAETLVALKVP